jgi:hypothetical protein
MVTMLALYETAYRLFSRFARYEGFKRFCSLVRRGVHC